MHGGTSVQASVPFWIMFVGAIGIVIGLVLYGPRLIKTVGSEITELDQMRAFSVAMATAVTVILASQLGLLFLLLILQLVVYLVLVFKRSS